MDSHTQQSHNIDKQTHPKHNKPQNTCLSCSMLTHTPLKDTRKQQEHAQGFSKNSGPNCEIQLTSHHLLLICTCTLKHKPSGGLWETLHCWEWLPANGCERNEGGN